MYEEVGLFILLQFTSFLTLDFFKEWWWCDSWDLYQSCTLSSCTIDFCQPYFLKLFRKPSLHPKKRSFLLFLIFRRIKDLSSVVYLDSKKKGHSLGWVNFVFVQYFHFVESLSQFQKRATLQSVAKIIRIQQAMCNCWHSPSMSHGKVAFISEKKDLIDLSLLVDKHEVKVTLYSLLGGDLARKLSKSDLMHVYYQYLHTSCVCTSLS